MLSFLNEGQGLTFFQGHLVVHLLLSRSVLGLRLLNIPMDKTTQKISINKMTQKMPTPKTTKKYHQEYFPGFQLFHSPLCKSRCRLDDDEGSFPTLGFGGYFKMFCALLTNSFSIQLLHFKIISHMLGSLFQIIIICFDLCCRACKLSGSFALI